MRAWTDNKAADTLYVWYDVQTVMPHLDLSLWSAIYCHFENDDKTGIVM